MGNAALVPPHSCDARHDGSPAELHLAPQDQKDDEQESKACDCLAAMEQDLAATVSDCHLTRDKAGQRLKLASDCRAAIEWLHRARRLRNRRDGLVQALAAAQAPSAAASDAPFLQRSREVQALHGQLRAVVAEAAQLRRDALVVGLRFLDGNSSGLLEPEDMPQLPLDLFARLDVQRRHAISPDDLRTALDRLENAIARRRRLADQTWDKEDAKRPGLAEGGSESEEQRRTVYLRQETSFLALMFLATCALLALSSHAGRAVLLMPLFWALHRPLLALWLALCTALLRPHRRCGIPELVCASAGQEDDLLAQRLRNPATRTEALTDLTRAIAKDEATLRDIHSLFLHGFTETLLASRRATQSRATSEAEGKREAAGAGAASAAEEALSGEASVEVAFAQLQSLEMQVTRLVDNSERIALAASLAEEERQVAQQREQQRDRETQELLGLGAQGGTAAEEEETTAMDTETVMQEADSHPEPSRPEGPAPSLAELLHVRSLSPSEAAAEAEAATADVGAAGSGTGSGSGAESSTACPVLDHIVNRCRAVPDPDQQQRLVWVAEYEHEHGQAQAAARQQEQQQQQTQQPSQEPPKLPQSPREGLSPRSLLRPLRGKDEPYPGKEKLPREGTADSPTGSQRSSASRLPPILESEPDASSSSGGLPQRQVAYGSGSRPAEEDRPVSSGKGKKGGEAARVNATLRHIGAAPPQQQHQQPQQQGNDQSKDGDKRRKAEADKEGGGGGSSSKAVPDTKGEQLRLQELEKQARPPEPAEPGSAPMDGPGEPAVATNCSTQNLPACP